MNIRPLKEGEDSLGPDVEVGTSIASRLLGVSQRTVRGYCDGDVLREGRDWRRHTPRSPYIIRRRALVAKKLGGLGDYYPMAATGKPPPG